MKNKDQLTAIETGIAKGAKKERERERKIEKERDRERERDEVKTNGWLA